MALEASDGLSDNIWVNWKHNCRYILNTSNTLLPCVTSWENQKKSTKISEENCGPPPVWFIFGYNPQMPEGATFICSNYYMQVINTLGRSIHHPAQEGDGFCVPEINVFWCNLRTKAKHLVKMLAEAGKRLLKDVLKDYSARKKPLLQKLHKKSQITVCKCTQGQRPSFLEACPVVWWK